MCNFLPLGVCGFEWGERSSCRTGHFFVASSSPSFFSLRRKDKGRKQPIGKWVKHPLHAIIPDCTLPRLLRMLKKINKRTMHTSVCNVYIWPLYKVYFICLGLELSKPIWNKAPHVKESTAQGLALAQVEKKAVCVSYPVFHHFLADILSINWKSFSNNWNLFLVISIPSESSELSCCPSVSSPPPPVGLDWYNFPCGADVKEWLHSMVVLYPSLHI